MDHLLYRGELGEMHALRLTDPPRRPGDRVVVDPTSLQLAMIAADVGSVEVRHNVRLPMTTALTNGVEEVYWVICTWCPPMRLQTAKVDHG